MPRIYQSLRNDPNVSLHLNANWRNAFCCNKVGKMPTGKKWGDTFGEKLSQWASLVRLHSALTVGYVFRD